MATGLGSYSKTAADNSNASSEITLSDSMAPNAVDNTQRQIMADIAEWRDDTGGGINLAGGTTAYTLTTNGSVSSLAAGRRVVAVVNAANTAASTLNVDSLGAKAIRKVIGVGTTPNDVALDANDLVIDQHAIFQYDPSANAAAGAWILLNPMGLGVVTIASGSIAAAATQAITSIPAYFRSLQLVIIGASCDTATRKLQVLISVDNGSNYIVTNYTTSSDDGTTPIGLTTVFASQASTQAAAATVSMAVDIRNYQGGLYPMCFFNGGDSAGLEFSGSGTYFGGTSAVNALQLIWNGAGNFDAGTYVLYGVR